jgi:oxygen-independent coproporphyrinogen-3 oxidase
MSPLGLYVHIPFCQSLCSYCNFHRGLFDADVARRYVAALEREIGQASDGRPVDTIFFGGGTPSMLEPGQIARVIRACRDAFDVSADAEITLETNPETVTPERMAAFAAGGVNRVSLGAQSFEADELRRLERVHSVERVGQAVAAVREAGIENISLDLMMWLPGQTHETWRRSVDHALSLDPGHLSLYMLELYPNAPLKDAMARRSLGSASSHGPTADWVQVADDQAADMYLDAFQRLDCAGYAQYEISNAARPGRESRHNLKYWSAGAWRGFGSGAHSTLDGRRWQNVADTAAYVERVDLGADVTVGESLLSKDAQVEEALFTGLRLTAGILRNAFIDRFGIDPWDVYREALVDPVEAGLVWHDDRAFGLTRAGMLVSNEVAARLLGDAPQNAALSPGGRLG